MRVMGIPTVLALTLLLSACGGSDSPTSPGDVTPTLSESLETSSLSFHFTPGDGVESDWQEAYHEWATARLGVSLPGKIQYYKYASDAQMRSLVGRGCCFAEPETLTIHTLWPRDDHEVVHVYAGRIGRPSNFLSEGLAVAFQVDPVGGRTEPWWNGLSVHLRAGGFLEGGTLVPLTDFLTTEDFRSHDSNTSYPQAGSFVDFLIDRHGLDRYLQLYRRGDVGDSEGRIRSDFQDVYGLGVEQAEAAWHAFLRDR